ncbi:hypothetical protein [Hymenobacter metallicola]|uniref:Uncharacterized protein n=1 Tax=Hymenobacter metallicola TaxID=2563114 RepID=A0A4Z0QJY6_9BACT|nr:hypothetical protein [Hymenobacter metallicola]TGE29816.1 hypothetical protein E5K02_10255 [Hymenobacter metallicola]
MADEATSQNLATDTSTADVSTPDALTAFTQNFASSYASTGSDSAAPSTAAAAAPAEKTSTDAATEPTAGAGTDASTSTDTTQATAFDETAYLTSKFGDKYKTADELAAELSQAEQLRQNQLTDEHKRSLALLSDPETRREYLRLADTDYTKMDALQAMRENFARKNPQYDAEEADGWFNKWATEKFGAAVGVDPDHPDFEETAEYRADKLLMDKQAERDRQELTSYRDERTSALLAGVSVPTASSDQTAAAPTITPEIQAQLDSHYANVDSFIGAGLDLTVELPDGKQVTLSAGSTPEETELARQVMRDPLTHIQNFVYPDGKTVSLENLALLSAVFSQGNKLFANAVKIGQDLVPPHVELDTLTNAGTTATASAASTTFSPEAFARQFAAQNGIGN